MNKPSGLASKLRALLKAKETPMWGVIIVLVIVIIFQQIQISELQWRVDEDHDGSSVDSVAGRLYILEGMANKHSDQLDNILRHSPITKRRCQVRLGTENNYNGCTQSLKFNRQKLTLHHSNRRI